jgi:hypothetical protein
VSAWHPVPPSRRRSTGFPAEATPGAQARRRNGCQGSGPPGPVPAARAPGHAGPNPPAQRRAPGAAQADPGPRQRAADYFPWIPYRDTLRTFQSYLAKMPREAIGLFPQLRTMVDQVTAQPAVFVPESPAEQAEEAVQDAAGKIARRGRGQRFQLDQKAKVAVEAHAMNAATEFYGKDWYVKDVHATESYDLICRRGDEVKRVEVKGTTTDGAEVILTPNEVTHARENPCTALFVLSGITIERAEDGTVTATGGKHCCFDPWRLDDGTLTPVGFRYQVPASLAEDA